MLNAPTQNQIDIDFLVNSATERHTATRRTGIESCAGSWLYGSCR